MPFKDSEHERYGLIKGDLVMCEGGEPGRCASLGWIDPGHEDPEGLASYSVQRASESALRRVQLPVGCVGLERSTSTTPAQRSSTSPGKMLARFEMVLPPIKEQRRLVARIQEAFGRQKKWNPPLDAQLEQSTRLRQAGVEAGV
jgi:type I restriction enzyme S subunit